MRVCIAKTRRNEYAKDGHRAYRETVFFTPSCPSSGIWLRKIARNGRGRKKARAMTMRKLSKQEIERIVSLLRESKPLPDDYKTVLFDTEKEYKLSQAYA